MEDLIKGKGPLGGILTGLTHSGSHLNFVMACDMPFPQRALIELLLEKCCDYDVVIPEAGGDVEPLFAIYSKSCMPVIMDHLQKDDLKVRSVLSELRVRKISEGEIESVDPERRSFFNINTNQDLKKAQAILQRARDSRQRL